MRNSDIVNNLAEGSNALHILVQYNDCDSNDLSRCAELLMQKHINAAQHDTKNRSPLYFAKLNKLDNIVTIIEDFLRTTGKITEELTLVHEDRLIEYLHNGLEDDFVNYFDSNIGDIVIDVYRQLNLLKFCEDNNLPKVAAYLLQRIIETATTDHNDIQEVIELATKKPHNKLILKLLELGANVSTTMLITCLKSINNTTDKYRECYDILISHIKKQCLDDTDIYLLLNGQDGLGNTPLHYAVRNAGPDVIEELLTLGSSLGSCNNLGIMPIKYIDHDILLKHLDSCIICDSTDKDWDKEDLEVVFDFRSLVAPRVTRHESTDNLSGNDDNSVNGLGLKEETKVIYFMSQNIKMRYLLKHPVITSCLFAKWWKARYICWLNLSLYLTFYAALSEYIVFHYADLPKDMLVQLYSAGVSYTILCITLVLLYFRELFQLTAAPKNYWRRFENYIEITLIVTATIIVSYEFPTSTKRQMSAIMVLLASLEVVLISGQLPFFSLYVTMLKTVSVNFFKMFIWYFNIVSAFALSFFILFTPLPSEADNTFFDTPYRSIFKTIIMMTGEFDASNINFKAFPITSVIIFTTFVFMIAIILLNLLSGLAISDTQMLRNEAEILSYIAKANYIYYMESLLCPDGLPIYLFQKFDKYVCSLSKFSIMSWIMKHLFVTNRQLIVYPNDTIFSALTHMRNMLLYLDSETVTRTKDIIQKRTKEEECDLKKFFEKIDSFDKKIDTLLEMLIK
ncbi:transient receptor potential cation channel protein painless-like isoform X2 [Rhynchophorus ferrugineus]